MLRFCLNTGRTRRTVGQTAVGAALSLLVAAGAAHAAERVTLTNGFDLICDHHSAAGNRVRLYMDSGNANFVELAAVEIASSEHLDLPVAPPKRTPLIASDGKLSEAELHELLARAGNAHDLDIDLLASVVRQESGGNSHAVSRAGAEGLMQLMPGTAADLGVGNAFAPGENINGGTAYLDGLLRRYHDNLALALAAYNAGPAAVDRWHGIPPYRETRAYVARVIHEFNRRVAARQTALAAR
ncbi:MAG TPA: lytic transglycosylase domain-containing protein [Silvibacterium sp.]|jgi:soluble lytic murein transglycosylase-like protein|nr:lytic transglycosylase domain-containing protein [Silvibacterium sp.]